MRLLTLHKALKERLIVSESKMVICQRKSNRFCIIRWIQSIYVSVQNLRYSRISFLTENPCALKLVLFVLRLSVLLPIAGLERVDLFWTITQVRRFPNNEIHGDCLCHTIEAKWPSQKWPLYSCTWYRAKILLSNSDIEQTGRVVDEPGKSRSPLSLYSRLAPYWVEKSIRAGNQPLWWR